MIYKKLIIVLLSVSLLLLSGCSNEEIDYVDLYCKEKGFKGYIEGDFFGGAVCYANLSEKVLIDSEEFYTWKKIYIKEQQNEKEN